MDLLSADMGSSSAGCLQTGNRGDDPCLTKGLVKIPGGSEACQSVLPRGLFCNPLIQASDDTLWNGRSITVLRKKAKFGDRRRVRKGGDFRNFSRQFSLSRSALDAECETASRGAVDLQIVGVGTGKQFFDDRLELPVRDVFLCEKSAAKRVGFDGALASAKLLWKAGVLGITRGSVGGHLCVRGKSINRRTKSGADRLCDFRGNGHDANGQHK